MLFTSFEYLILLVVTFAVYYLLPWRLRIIMILVASYIFYSYWEPYYAIIIAVTTLVDYFAAMFIDQSDNPRTRKALLWTSVVANLGMLGYFKYTNFALDTLRPLLAKIGLDTPSINVILPIGISFYTFQEMSYTIDVYRRKYKPTKDLILFSTYVSFFPQLVAGPIERAHGLLEQLKKLQKFDFNKICSGVGLIFIGLAKKLIIADRLFFFSLPKFQQPYLYDSFELVVSMFLAAIALYLDFGAYTDIARGSARMLGIELSRNFWFPFAAKNPSEYWQRWHMTLTNWIRDYVFISLGGTRHRARAKTIFNLLFAMALVGLWHGASWKFVLWGVGMGLALVVYFVLRLTLFRGKKRAPSKPVAMLGWVVMLAYLIPLTTLFFCPDVYTAIDYIKGITYADWESVMKVPVQLAAIFVIVFFVFQFVAVRIDYMKLWNRLPVPVQSIAFTLLFYLVLFGSVPTSKKFVYFQF